MAARPRSGWMPRTGLDAGNINVHIERTRCHRSSVRARLGLSLAYGSSLTGPEAASRLQGGARLVMTMAALGEGANRMKMW